MVVIQKLTDATLRKLAAALDRLARIVHELRKRQARLERSTHAIGCVVGKADSPIPAMIAGAPGSGPVSIWRLWNGVWEDAGYNETVYNFASEDVSAGVFLIMLRHEQSGAKIVIFEDCG